jgi:hypothetical protein
MTDVKLFKNVQNVCNLLELEMAAAVTVPVIIVT